MHSMFRSLALVPLAACGGQGGVVDTEGCSALESGPFAPVTAGTAIDATAPVITLDSTAFAINLPASGVGFVGFDSPDDTEYIVFADRSISISAFTMDGTELMAQARATSTSACSIVKQRDIIELAVDRFYFGFGPDAGGPINVVLLPFSPD